MSRRTPPFEGPVSTATIESRSPQAPDDIVISASATDRQATQAAAQAREAGRAWAAAPATERADALIGAAASLADAADDVADLIVREVGKTIVEARVEVDRGVRILRFHAEAALLPDGATHPRIRPPRPAP